MAGALARNYAMCRTHPASPIPLRFFCMGLLTLAGCVGLACTTIAADPKAVT